MGQEMKQTYRDALLEYLALTQLQDELRGEPDYDLRNAVSAAKIEARDAIAKELGKKYR